MQDQFDVAEVQRLLGVRADGELGPVTAAAIAAWKRSRGLRGEGLTAAEHRRLLADVPLLAVRQMERWVGLHEEPRGSNRVRRARRRWRRGSAYRHPSDGWGTPGARSRCSWRRSRTGARRPREACAGASSTRSTRPAVLAAAKAGSAGLRVVPPALAFRGDLVLFDWDLRHGDPVDHVGRLVEIACGRACADRGRKLRGRRSRCPQRPRKWLCSGICSGFVTFSLEWGVRSR